jgi:mRNA (guanine-N7-)-methyltransferase
MPYDPVREAVMNSPIATSQPPFYKNRNDSPTSSSSSNSVLVSPTLGRRATDLAVLLNAEPEEPRTPVRSSSLSHLLLPVDVEDIEDNKLTHVVSLRRNSQPEPRQEEFYFSQRPSSSHSKQVLPSSPLSQTFDAGSSSSRPITASPTTRSPTINSRPSSSSRPRSKSTVRPRTASLSTMLPPPPPPPTLPYNPSHRVTPADSVLRPITHKEIESYRATYSIGSRRLKKRKRGQSSEPDPSDQPPTKKLAGDVGVVVEHCEYYCIHFHCVRH